MHATSEPLSGLIEFLQLDDDGQGGARHRYYSMDPHRFPNGAIAGHFEHGVYTCRSPSGAKLLEADGADGVRIVVYGDEGSIAATHHASAGTGGRCELEPESGKFFAWHPNGSVALIATLPQAMYDAWGIDARVSPRAVLSPRTHEALGACITPWLAAASRLDDPGLRLHAEQGLAALRASNVVETATVVALLALRLPTLDHDASLLCQMLMSADPTVRSLADEVLDQLGPHTARAAMRLAWMRNEDRVATVRDWVDAALLRLGRPGLAELADAVAQDQRWTKMVGPVIEWLEDHLGQE
jgi:hypothetical protein